MSLTSWMTNWWSSEEVTDKVANELVSPRTHDTSHIQAHIKFDEFVKQVENSVNDAVFPNNTKPPYKEVHALLVSWKHGDGEFSKQLGKLAFILEHQFGYHVEEWEIPGFDEIEQLEVQDVFTSANSKFSKFVQDYGKPDHLLILYYGGHASLSVDKQQIWMQDDVPVEELHNTKTLTLPWGSMQENFLHTSADVLFLLDCCTAAGSARPLIKAAKNQGIVHGIAAAGFESGTPLYGVHSFTSNLCHELERLERTESSFTDGGLHTHLLSRMSGHRPDDGIVRRVSPIHFVVVEHKFPQSIRLGKWKTARPKTATSDTANEKLPLTGSLEQFQRNSFTHTKVLISVSLVNDFPEDMDARAWHRWLRGVPALVEHVRIEGVFRSQSTLMVVSLPIAAWDLLPDHLATNFIGFVSSGNLLALEPFFEDDTVVVRSEDPSGKIEEGDTKTRQDQRSDIPVRVPVATSPKQAYSDARRYLAETQGDMTLWEADVASFGGGEDYAEQAGRLAGILEARIVKVEELIERLKKDYPQKDVSESPPQAVEEAAGLTREPISAPSAETSRTKTVAPQLTHPSIQLPKQARTWDLLMRLQSNAQRFELIAGKAVCEEAERDLKSQRAKYVDANQKVPSELQSRIDQAERYSRIARDRIDAYNDEIGGNLQSSTPEQKQPRTTQLETDVEDLNEYLEGLLRDEETRFPKRLPISVPTTPEEPGYLLKEEGGEGEGESAENVEESAEGVEEVEEEAFRAQLAKLRVETESQKPPEQKQSSEAQADKPQADRPQADSLHRSLSEYYEQGSTKEAQQAGYGKSPYKPYEERTASFLEGIEAQAQDERPLSLMQRLALQDLIRSRALLISVRNLELERSDRVYLHAECRDLDGNWRKNRIPLDYLLANYIANGQEVALGLHSSSRNEVLEYYNLALQKVEDDSGAGDGSLILLLRADLQKPDGTWKENVFVLLSYWLINDNGYLDEVVPHGAKQIYESPSPELSTILLAQAMVETVQGTETDRRQSRELIDSMYLRGSIGPTPTLTSNGMLYANCRDSRTGGFNSTNIFLISELRNVDGALYSRREIDDFAIERPGVDPAVLMHSRLRQGENIRNMRLEYYDASMQLIPPLGPGPGTAAVDLQDVRDPSVFSELQNSSYMVLRADLLDSRGDWVQGHAFILSFHLRNVFGHLVWDPNIVVLDRLTATIPEDATVVENATS